MEEDTVELIDYLRIIWKRKILIIVVTLVCIGVGVGVGVMNSMSKLPVTYRADAVVKIGKKVVLRAPSTNISSFADLESPNNLTETLPLMYSIKNKEISGYHLDAEQIGTLSMIRLILKGPDREVERALKELVDILIDEHRRRAEASVVIYEDFIKKLKADAEMVQENVAIAEASLKEMKIKERIFMGNMVVTEAEMKEEKGGGDRSAFLNMLYLKTIDKERDLSKSRVNLRNIQWEILMHQTIIGSHVDYNTKMIGKIRSAAIKPKEKSTIHIFIVAGFIGLVLSLFLAFFIEYLGNARVRSKDNSA